MKKLLFIIILYPFSNLFAQDFLDFNSNTQLKKEGDSSGQFQQNVYESSMLLSDSLEINYSQITGLNSYYLLNDVTNRIAVSNKRIKEILKESEKVGFKSNFKEFTELANLETYVKNLEEIRENLITLNSLSGTPKQSRRFFPLRSVQQASYFFLNNPEGESKINFVKDISVIGNFEGLFSLKSNILTGVLPLATKYLPVKIAVNTTVSQTTGSESNNDDVQQYDVGINKLSNGGLFNVEFTYPIYFSNWNYFKDNSFIIYAPINYRAHIDDVADGAYLKDTYYYNEFSGSFLIMSDILSGKADNKSSIFGSVKYSYFTGNSNFREHIGYSDFWLGQLSLGLKIKNKFVISGTFPVYSNRNDIKDKMYGTLGLSFIPN